MQMNRNGKQKKDRNNEHGLLEKIVFITAILNLIEAVVDLIKEHF